MVASVAIIMSTYNGEKYLEEQLLSLFNQEEVKLTIFVRDDGSIDNTHLILKKYNNKIKMVFFPKGNLGVGNSFMETLYTVDSSFDYYAFCDQDDVWLPDKLKRSIFKLSNYEQKKPLLYCSNQTIVDEKLNIQGIRHEKILDTSYLQILTKNHFTGCTMVWNRELHLILSNIKRRPSKQLLEIRIHDVWVALVASLVGEIIYDSHSSIYYRQHSDNVVGIKHNSPLKVWYKKLLSSKLRNGRSLLAKELLIHFRGYLNDVQYSQLKKLSEYRSGFFQKWELLNDKDVFAFSKETWLGIKLKIIFNLI